MLARVLMNVQQNVFSAFKHLRIDVKDLARVDDDDEVRGGYGTVWFATMGSSDNAKRVAVKELRQSGKWHDRSRAAIVCISISLFQ